MAAATLYDLMKSWSSLGSADMAPFAVGFVVAFVAAYAAMRTFDAGVGMDTLPTPPPGVALPPRGPVKAHPRPAAGQRTRGAGEADPAGAGK